MDRAMLLEERAKHRDCDGCVGHCPAHCGWCGLYSAWPCPDSQILDLALQAEDYRKALERLEWSSTNNIAEYPSCPACFKPRDDIPNGRGGHAKDCWLAAALGETR